MLKGDVEIVGKEKIRVQPLADILDEYLPAGQEIDLLNIDVEGLDLQVLKSNNWEKYCPNVILIEDYSVQEVGLENSDIHQYLKKYRI